jgi:hypothetical protein
MFKIIELEIDPTLSGETGVFEVAWVEYPAIEQDMMIFSQQKFYKAPEYVAEKACQAIRENEKRGNPAGTQVGKVRAQQLCQRQEITLETVKRMKSFLERAATYNTGNWDDNGTIAYGLWGGPDALTWVDKILRQEENFQDLEDACWEGYIAVGLKPADDGSGRMVPNCVPQEDFMKFVYPNAGESKDEFVSRCVGVVMGEGKTQDQALGQCYGMWENREFAFDKVSFDWDGVLSTKEGRDLLEKEIGFGNYVYIISARGSVSNEMRQLASDYKIPLDRIYAVGSNVQKVRKIKDLGIIRHYDDNPVIKVELPKETILFDYDTSAIGGYVNYPESGTTNSMLVEPTEFDCGCLQKSNTYFEEADLDIFGYLAKHFEICPGAFALFNHLIEMNPDEETIGMIRSAAQIADNVFEIEKRVIENGQSTESDLKQAMILVDDFKDLMHEIDEELGMMHDVSFMDGHIMIIRDYLNEDGPTNQEFRKTLLELKNTDTEKFEAITSILLQGLNLEEVKQANFRDGQKLYRYSNFFPGVPDTREFCASIEEQFYRRTVIDLLRDTNIEFGHNRQPYSKWLYKGGPNCVHAWVEYEVKRRRGAEGDLITDVILIGPVAGLPGTPPRNMPLQGYYSEETRAKSKRAYAIERSQQGFNTTFMNEKQVNKCFGDLCQVGFSKSQDQLFAAVEEKRMIYTPLMIPNILIPRMDEVTREKYYVKFTPETINKIAKKFAIEGRNRMTNYEHSDKKFEDIVMVESWIVEGENDKAYQLGFTQEQIPVGTWMGGYYVLETPEGQDVWNNYIKNGKVRGASVEGNFILNFSALKDDDYLLGQIINILKNITE